jgi:ribosome maturation protein Sdo1
MPPNNSKPKPKTKQSSDSTPLSLESVRARRDAIDVELEAVRVQRQQVDRVLSEVTHKSELALLKAELQTELASHHADRAEVAANRARKYSEYAEAAKPDYLAILIITIGVSALVSILLFLTTRKHYEPTQQTIGQSSPAAISQ